METLNRLPFAAQSAVFQKLATITDVASLSKQERMKYDESLRMFRDTLVVMETERAKGREETNFEHARIMKALGITSDIISQVTGLSAEDIEKL